MLTNAVLILLVYIARSTAASLTSSIATGTGIATPTLFASSHVVVGRQETSTSTLDVSTTDLGDASSTSDTTSTARTALPSLRPGSSPIPLAPTIGLIMPDPFQPIYVGLNYTFGFVDTVPQPAPTVGGWLRQVQPLLIFPNYLVNVFPSSGQTSVDDPGAIPFGSGGLCGATAEDYPIGYPFLFQRTGWYMFVVNQTWLQANITSDNTCSNPLVGQRNFFASQTFSISPLPTTGGPEPPSPSTAFTVFAAVVTTTPGSLPVDPHDATKGERLGVGLGVAAGILGLILIVLTVWRVRQKRQIDAEALAFSRLSAADQAAFLLENPDSRLNAAHHTRFRHVPNGPPPPQGTLAYTQWYWHQMWDHHNRARYGANGDQYEFTVPQGYTAPPTGQGYNQGQRQGYGPVRNGTGRRGNKVFQ